MIKRCILASALSALALAPTLAHAQADPTMSRPGLLQAGVAISKISPDLVSQDITGITGYATFDVTPRLGAELSIHLGSVITPNDVAEDSFSIGPRYVYRIKDRYEPYAKVLFGIAKTVAQEPYVTASNPYGIPGTFGFVGFGAGLDIRVPHNITVRAIDLEYQDWYTWKPHGLSPVIYSIGASYRFDSIFGK